MTREASVAQIEIKVDAMVCAHRAFCETAIETPRFLQQRSRSARITVTDLRDGSAVPFQLPA